MKVGYKWVYNNTLHGRVILMVHSPGQTSTVVIREAKQMHIRITCACNVDPLTPHFYTVNCKIGVYRSIHQFLIFVINIDLRYT